MAQDETAGRSTYAVTTAEALKALASPLRMRLLGSLRFDGPATATELGRRIGESSGTTSYHLRLLERHGFIEEDPVQPNSRDRLWRARHRYTSWTASDFLDHPEARDAAQWARRLQIQAIGEAVNRFEERMDGWSRDWIDAAGTSDDTVRLTPDSLRSLQQRMWDLVRELVERDANLAEARDVFVYFGGVPWERGHSEQGSQPDADHGGKHRDRP